MNQPKRIAIVHDIISNYGGAERVLKSLLDLFPEADLYTSRVINTSTARLIGKDPNTIRTTFLQQFPGANLLNKVLTPLIPLAFESLDVSSYDLVITSTSHFAKSVITNPHQVHICYCHTPPRFLYHYQTETPHRNRGLLKPISTILDYYLRQYDFLTAQRPDFFITNSHTTQLRIAKFYKRDATIIYPPVSVEAFKPTSTTKDDYYIVVSRLVAYKQLHVVVEAFNRLQKRLIIVGDGPQKTKLKEISGPTIEFKGFVPTEKLIALYQKARASVFSSYEEDFGITPVESLASGTPVIALESGGATETVQHNKTGIFYKENTVDALCSAINEFEANERNFNQKTLVGHAATFSENTFKVKFKDLLLTHFAGSKY